MRGLTKAVLLAVLVFGLCWAGAIVWWRASGRSPSGAEATALLAAVPLAALAALMLVRVMLAGPPAAQAAQRVTPAPAVPPQASAPAALAVIASALRLPHGAAPAELAAALKEQKAHPALDPELQDDDGYPQMTARVGLADSARDGEALREQAITWLALNGHAGVEFGEEAWRTIALAGAVAVELGEAAATHAGMPGEPMLRLLPAWPGSWQPAQRGAANAWLLHLVAQQGWPVERIVAAAPDLALHTTAALAQLSATAQQRQAPQAPWIAMVLAADSHVGAASVAEWAGKGTIFSARRPQGMIPGEGAAGLLVTCPNQAVGMDLEAYAQLFVADAMRDASADGARRADPTMLPALAAQVLGWSGAEAAQVALLVADTGHRGTRTSELLAFAGALLPRLDAGEDVLRVGAACGSCGDVPLMAALAVGVQQALDLNGPVLCIGNEDPFRRSAALIRPGVAA